MLQEVAFGEFAAASDDLLRDCRQLPGLAFNKLEQYEPFWKDMVRALLGKPEKEYAPKYALSYWHDTDNLFPFDSGPAVKSRNNEEQEVNRFMHHSLKRSRTERYAPFFELKLSGYQPARLHDGEIVPALDAEDMYSMTDYAYDGEGRLKYPIHMVVFNAGGVLLRRVVNSKAQKLVDEHADDPQYEVEEAVVPQLPYGFKVNSVKAIATLLDRIEK